MNRKRKIGLGILVLLLIIQFIRRPKNISKEDFSSTDFLVTENVPQALALKLKSTCYDCHSNNTVYPWYSEVAPLSWWIQGHVNGGKQNLNFNEWSTYDAEKRNHKVEEIIEEIQERHMPLKSYSNLHKEARLSEEDIKSLTGFFKDLRRSI